MTQPTPTNTHRVLFAAARLPASAAAWQLYEGAPVTVVRELNAALRAAAMDSGLKDAVKKAKKSSRDSWGDFSRSLLEQSPAWKELLSAQYAAFRTHIEPVLNKHSEFGASDSEPYHVASDWLTRTTLDALGVTEAFDRNFLRNRFAKQRAPMRRTPVANVLARYLSASETPPRGYRLSGVDGNGNPVFFRGAEGVPGTRMVHKWGDEWIMSVSTGRGWHRVDTAGYSRFRTPQDVADATDQWSGLSQNSQIRLSDFESNWGRTAAAGVRLDNTSRQKVNADLMKNGLDGNLAFQRIGQALNVIAEVLQDAGLEQAEVFSASRFMGDDGRANFDIALSNPTDPFSPTPVANSMLAITWHKHDSGRYEVLAYLS